MIKKTLKVSVRWLLPVFFFANLFPVPLSFAHDEHFYKPQCWNDGSKDDGDGGDREPEVDPNTGVKLPYCDEEGEPVNVFNGNFGYRYQDIFVPSRGMPFEFTRYYNSQDICEGPFGQGWSHTFNITLIEVKDGAETCVLHRDNDGALHVFRQISDIDYEKITLDGYDVLKRYATFPESLRSLAPLGLNGGYHIREKQGKDYLFDFDGKLRVIADRNKNKMTLEYDSLHRLVKILDTANRQYTIDYNANNKIASITDFSGRKHTYAYNAQGILESVTMPRVNEFSEGSTTRYFYNEKNQLVNITDPEGNAYLSNTYDDLGRVIEQKYGTAVYHFVYANLKTTFVDGNGNSKEYYFNPDGTTKNEVVLFHASGIVPTSFTNTISYEYNSQKETTRITFPLKNLVEKEYDDNGNLLKITRRPFSGASDANSLVTAMTYEPNYNMLKTIIDPIGNTTVFDYDGHGNPLKITYPQVNGQTPIAEFTYNEYGQMETVKDPNQIVTKYEYNAGTGYLAKVKNNFGAPAPLGNESVNYAETQLGYDSVGNVISVTDSLGNTAHFEFDALNNLTKSVMPLPFAYKTLFYYDRNGNMTCLMQQANPDKTNWEMVGYEYDARDVVTAIKQYKNDGTYLLTTFAYDNNGNRLQVVNAEGQYTAYCYDEMNRVNQMTDAEGKVTLYRYNENGNLIEITDANGNVTSYQYDWFDRLWRKTFSDTSCEDYTYDKNLNLIRKVTRSLQVISYEYDPLNRLTKKNYQNHPVTTYGYDRGSRLTSVQNPVALMQYTYNGLNQVIQSQIQMSGITAVIGYDYNATGNRTKLIYPDGVAITYDYDALSRLTAVNDQSLAVIAAYNYDELSQRTQLTYSNNTHATYQYDELNRLTQLAHFPVSQLPTYSFDYDAIGNRKAMAVNGANWHYYEYDKISQLKAIDFPEASEFPDTWYVYDNVGNRKTETFGTTTHYSSNNLNQYTSIDSAALAYDANGNLISDPVTPAGNGASGTNAYVYDDENRLVTATTADNIIEYGYDGFGRRIAKNIFDTNHYPLNAIRYIYDGAQIIAEYDGSGTLVRKYINGLGIDEPILLDNGTNKYYYHFDGLGSVTALTDASGQVIETYEYGVYGDTIIKDAGGTVLSQSAVGNRFGFTGRELDAETGLYYYRARYYSPELGRFLQTDPVGYYDSMNLYQYCGNNPGNWVDPMGLKVFVYFSDGWGAPGVNHAYVWSTELGRGKGMDGSSGSQGGDGVSDRQNGKCIEVKDLNGMTEEEFIEQIREWPGWNKGLWYPIANDCHTQLEKAFDYVGVDYPGRPGDRIDGVRQALGGLIYKFKRPLFGF
jgi:RHS repeat-associated protein